MKILVAIKHVPDTETKIKIGPDGCSPDESGVKWILSPYDEYALEEALQIRDAKQGEVVVVSAGRPAAQESLRKALAMGADRAILVGDPRLDRADSLTRARVLAGVARDEGAELLLTGKYGVGTDEGLTGPMIAEVLGWPHVAAVSDLKLDTDKLVARRGIEGGVEVQESTLPAVVTCEKGLNEPRYASLKGIMQAKKKPLDVKQAGDLGIGDQELDEPRLVWDSLELPPSREGGRLIDGTPQDAAAELARLLREEAKVI